MEEVWGKENEVERSYLLRKRWIQYASNDKKFLKQSISQGSCVPWHHSHLAWQTACVHWGGLRPIRWECAAFWPCWGHERAHPASSCHTLFPSPPFSRDPGLQKSLARFPSRFPGGQPDRRFCLWAVLLGFASCLLRPFLFKLGMSWKCENLV